MTNETMTNAWFHRLKAANRMLIKLNGGIEASADITSLSKSQIGRCHSDSDTELLPLPAVMRLEAECGNFAVTRAQAELHGCKLSDPRERVVDGACVMGESFELTRRFAAYQQNSAIAFSDLKLTRAEAAQAIKDIQSVMEKAAELLQVYAGVVADGGAPTAKLSVVGE